MGSFRDLDCVFLNILVPLDTQKVVVITLNPKPQIIILVTYRDHQTFEEPHLATDIPIPCVRESIDFKQNVVGSQAIITQ